MITLTVTPLKIAVCFIAALLTTLVVRIILRDKRDLWFKRTQPKFLLTIRGKLGDYLALGYPRTLEGALVLLLLTAVLMLEIYLILTCM